MSSEDKPIRKGEERNAFLFIILAPVISVALVGGYGFLTWMYQLIVGPPGPPGG